MYKDRYSEYLESVPESIRFCKETGKRPVLAYTSNLDVLVKWDAESFNRLLDTYLKEEPSFENGESIRSMEDFARIMSYFAIHGYGGEVDITSQEVVDILPEYFEMSYGLGGTCAQGAAALGSMGFPVLVHLIDHSPEVIDRMSYGKIECVKDNKTVPVEECAVAGESLPHFIVQYHKDDVIRALGKEYKIRISNRLIMGYDRVHKVMPVKEEFLSYCEDHAEQMSSYDISGFNAIVDMELMAERLSRLTKHYAVIKERNPSCRIYFESAHFISNEIREYTYRVLSESMDIMGMNEEELADLTKKMGRAIDTDDLESVLKGMEYLLKVYPLEGIVMHSKDYALYYGNDMPGIDLEKGLTLGNLISGTRARTGRYGSYEDCVENLKLPLSEVGVRFAEILEKLELPHKAVLVPSRYMEKPKTTIGLGDSFVAGMQICFIQ